MGGKCFWCGYEYIWYLLLLSCQVIRDIVNMGVRGRKRGVFMSSYEMFLGDEVLEVGVSKIQVIVFNMIFIVIFIGW